MEARLLQLEATVRQLGQPQNVQQTYQAPYWNGVRLPDSTVMATDWTDTFEDASITPRVVTRAQTAGGELFVSQWTDHCPGRWEIAWDAKAAYDVNLRVLADGAGNYKFTFNGDETTYSGPQDITLSVRQGRNDLRIIKDSTGADRISVEGVLFDGVNATWIPPG